MRLFFDSCERYLAAQDTAFSEWQRANNSKIDWLKSLIYAHLW